MSAPQSPALRWLTAALLFAGAGLSLVLPFVSATLLTIAIGAVAATSILGQIATYPNLTPWYAGLAKPSFNPPNWVFGPVWTTLYALMAFAFWRVLRIQDRSEERRWAIGGFLGQLALNAAWSWMFFGAVGFSSLDSLDSQASSESDAGS